MTMTAMPAQESVATTHRSVNSGKYTNNVLARFFFFLFVVKRFIKIGTNDREEALALVLHSACIAQFNPFVVLRSRGRTATRSVVPPSCARMVSKKLALLIKRGSFLCATMLQGKLNSSTNMLQI